MPSAPCPGAGSISSASSRAVMRAREAQARQAGGGEHDRRRTRRGRAWRGASRRCRAAGAPRGAGWRSSDLRLAPQARGADGGAVGHFRQGVVNWYETKASRGSSRAVIAASTKPGGSSAGTSFIECTARSARPSAIAFSSSLTNRPLPPALVEPPVDAARRRAWTSAAARRAAPACALCSRSAMCCACHSASRLRRVAMTSFFMSPGRAPPAIAAGSPAGVLPARRAPPASAASSSSLGARSKPRIAARATRQLRWMRTKRVANSLLERDQRLLDQVLARARAHGDVLLFGAQVEDVAHRQQHDAVALRERKVLARRLRGLLERSRSRGRSAFFSAAASRSARTGLSR